MTLSDMAPGIGGAALGVILYGWVFLMHRKLHKDRAAERELQEPPRPD